MTYFIETDWKQIIIGIIHGFIQTYETAVFSYTHILKFVK